MRGLAAKVAALLAWGAGAPAHAEHRAALLLDPGGGGMARERAALEAFGFRCEVGAARTEKELRRGVEDWARRTPTDGTALVLVAGELAGEPAGFVAGNGRSVSAESLLRPLAERGGSAANILLATEVGAGAATAAAQVPEGCAVGALAGTSGAGGDLLDSVVLVGSGLPEGFALRGGGSAAVAPPDGFPGVGEVGDEWVDGHGMVFCWCPPGRYTAGSPVGTAGRYPDEERREVTVASGFWSAKFELTEGQNPRGKSRNSIATDKRHPANRLHLDDARSMLRRRTEEEREAGRLPAGWEYALPTGAQWEHLARAGTAGLWYFGDRIADLPGHANVADASFAATGDIFSRAADRDLDDGAAYLATVGSYAANPWGLHDVYGNVAEWCEDGAVRGGGWCSVPANCRSGYRDSRSARDEQDFVGYRIVIRPTPPKD